MLKEREAYLAAQQSALAEKKRLQAQKAAHPCAQAVLEIREQKVNALLGAVDGCLDVDDDLELALLLSLGIGLDTSSGETDLELARRLQLEEDGREDLRSRLTREEALTAEVLGDVQQFLLASAENSDGTVTIGSHTYRRVECGASYGSHSNLCGYLSLTHRDGARAVELKNRLAPFATEFSRKIGAFVNFAAPDALADTEVLRAFVVLEKTPVCVFDAITRTATTYRTDACVGDCVYLYLCPGHFQRLVSV
jgi:hypothetical protein